MAAIDDDNDDDSQITTMGAIQRCCYFNFIINRDWFLSRVSYLSLRHLRTEGRGDLHARDAVDGEDGEPPDFEDLWIGAAGEKCIRLPPNTQH